MDFLCSDGFLISVAIEVLQYCFRLGRAETDDVDMQYDIR